MMGHTQPLHDALGMRHVACGEDDLAAGKRLERRLERRVGLDRRVVDVVHVIEEMRGIDAVQGHHAAHRSAVLAPVLFLHAARLLGVDLEQVGDVAADAHVDLGEQVATRRIERVVEVEQPDVGVVARSFV